MSSEQAGLPAEEDEVNELAYTSQKEAMLFLIDISPSMLKPNDKGTCAARTALECAYSVMTTKVFSAPNDMIGVVLYNSKTSQLDKDKKYSTVRKEHMHLLVDLDVPGADLIRVVRDLLKEPNQFNEVCQASEERASPAELIELARDIFQNQAPRFNFKRLVLITDDDDPMRTHRALTQQFKTRTKDLYSLGVTIEPIFLSNEAPFDSIKFWDDIIERQEEDAGELVLEGEARLVDMQETIKALQTPKKATFSIPMEIAPGLSIGIKGYVLFKEQKVVRTTYIDNSGARPQTAKADTTLTCEDTVTVLDKTQIKQGYKFGSENVTFDAKEMQQIKRIESPVLRIIGYKSLEKLDFCHNIAPAYFIYPHEATHVGSKRTFAALHRVLLQKKQFALCWFIPRRNASPVVAAMMASELELSENKKSQLSPPGFFVIPLPFADDLRNPPRSRPLPSEDLASLFGDIIGQITLPAYDPAKRSNPALQWHYKALEAMALGEDVPQLADQPDESMPNFKAIHKRAGKAMLAFVEALEMAVEQVQDAGPAVPTKRKGASPVASSKKAKPGPGSVPSLEDLRAAVLNGTLGQFKVPELKAALSAHASAFDVKPASSLKKQEMIDFITEKLT